MEPGLVSRYRGGYDRCYAGSLSDFDKADVIETSSPEELLEIDEAIETLAAADPKAAELVKARFFAGLSFAQAAELLGISRTSAHRLWTYARVQLFRHLYGEGDNR